MGYNAGVKAGFKFGVGVGLGFAVVAVLALIATGLLGIAAAKATSARANAAAVKVLAISDAKELSLVIEMYAAGADDWPPPRLSDVRGFLDADSPVQLSRFTYTAPAHTKLSDMPRGTELAREELPEGYALALVDGRSRWITKPR